MSVNDLIQDIDTLIKNSRFYIYDSEEKYLKAISKLEKLKKLLEEGKYNKVFTDEGDDDIDS